MAWYLNDLSTADPGFPVTQGRAEQNPTGHEARPSTPTPSPDRLTAFLHSLQRRVINFILDWIATALVMLVVLALAFAPSVLHGFQDQLVAATRNLNPIRLFDYVFETTEYFFAPVRSAFDAVFGSIGGLIDWIMASIQHLISPSVLPLVRLTLLLIASPLILIVAIAMTLALFVYMFLAILLAPITLTLAIISKGTALETVLLLIVFLPLMYALFRIVTAEADLNLRERAGLLWFGTMMALWITTLFYFVVQMAMLGTAWALGKSAPSATTAVATSAVSVFFYQCTVSTVEGSITQRVADVLRKVAKNLIRAG